MLKKKLTFISNRQSLCTATHISIQLRHSQCWYKSLIIVRVASCWTSSSMVINLSESKSASLTHDLCSKTYKSNAAAACLKSCTRGKVSQSCCCSSGLSLLFAVLCCTCTRFRDFSRKKIFPLFPFQHHATEINSLVCAYRAESAFEPCSLCISTLVVCLWSLRNSLISLRTSTPHNNSTRWR